MSIFEPIPREPRADEPAEEIADATTDDESGSVGGSLDPRSITIAGAVVAAIVVLGLIASNTAEPPDTRPLIVPRVEPGAAAVEQAEAAQADRQPTPAPSASAVSSSTEPRDEAEDDAQRVESESFDDQPKHDDSKRDDKPGKGHGRGR